MSSSSRCSLPGCKHRVAASTTNKACSSLHAGMLAAVHNNRSSLDAHAEPPVIGAHVGMTTDTFEFLMQVHVQKTALAAMQARDDAPQLQSTLDDLYANLRIWGAKVDAMGVDGDQWHEIFKQHTDSAVQLVLALKKGDDDGEKTHTDALVRNKDDVTRYWSANTDVDRTTMDDLWMGHLGCTLKYLNVMYKQRGTSSRAAVDACVQQGRKLGQYLDASTIMMTVY